MKVNDLMSLLLWTTAGVAIGNEVILFFRSVGVRTRTRSHRSRSFRSLHWRAEDECRLHARILTVEARKAHPPSLGLFTRG